MGYYTYFNGKVIEGANEKEIAITLAKLPSFEGNVSDIETIDTLNDIMEEPMKWYSYIEDMKQISAQFPNAIIKIHGEGEDNGDLWNAYFKNGKAIVYSAQIIYPEFDKKDLQ